MDELILELIELIKQTAPELWRIAQRQVVVETTRHSLGVIVAILFLLIGFLIVKKTYRWKAWEDIDIDDDFEVLMIGYFLGGGISLFSFLMILGRINVVIGLLINPEYYAIQEIIKLVK